LIVRVSLRSPRETSSGPLADERKGRADARPSEFFRRYDQACFFALLTGLTLAPVWFGSERPIAWDVNAAYFGALLCIYEAGRLLSGRPHPVALRRLWFPALAVIVVIGWSLFQISSLSPIHAQNPVWQMAREALGEAFPGAVSVFPDATAISLMKFVTGAMVFWLTLQLTRSPQRARRFVEAVALSGALYAAYGLVAFFVFPKTILWFPKFTYLDSVTSTFVNRNSYATYAGIGLIAAFAVAFSQFIGALRGPQSHGRRFAGLLANVAGAGGAWIAAVFIISIAWIMTGSRGGVVATLVALAVFFGLGVLRGRKNALAGGFSLVAGLLLIGVGAFSYGDYLADRIAQQGFASEDRLAAYQLAWASIQDAPIFGFGWGTFWQVFPIYRDSSLDPFPVWDMAHNTYLELLQGLGIPVAVLLMLAMAGLIGRCIFASITRKVSATAPLVAAASSVLVLLHALVDFSLQIQAITLTWLAILAAGVAQSWSSRASTQ